MLLGEEARMCVFLVSENKTNKQKPKTPHFEKAKAC